MRSTLSCALSALVLFACKTPDEPAATPTPPEERAAVAAETTAPAQTPAAPHFGAQAGWIVATPTSNMRVAQFVLPGSAGDAELVVYFFGERGGSLEANLERWAGQFEQPDGGASHERMLRSDREVAGLIVTVVDLSGTYVAETSPGSGEHVNKPLWRMLAAVIEAPEGPYYAKLTGPAVTVAHWEDSFERFLDDLR
jgi:hypothetical protein